MKEFHKHRIMDAENCQSGQTFKEFSQSQILWNDSNMYDFANRNLEDQAFERENQVRKYHEILVKEYSKPDEVVGRFYSVRCVLAFGMAYGGSSRTPDI